MKNVEESIKFSFFNHAKYEIHWKIQPMKFNEKTMKHNKKQWNQLKKNNKTKTTNEKTMKTNKNNLLD